MFMFNIIYIEETALLPFTRSNEVHVSGLKMAPYKDRKYVQATLCLEELYCPNKNKQLK